MKIKVDKEEYENLLNRVKELEENIAVKTRFKTYIVSLIDEIVKIVDDKKCLKKSKKK